MFKDIVQEQDKVLENQKSCSEYCSIIETLVKYPCDFLYTWEDSFWDEVYAK